MNLLKAQINTGSTDTLSSSGASASLPVSGKRLESSVHAVELRSLSPGQTFSGQITDIRNGQVTVSVSGQMLHAKFESSVNLCMGEVVNFVVRENDGERILIAPLPSKSGLAFVDVALYKALDASGLPATDKNIDIISELLRNQMAVDKESIRQLLSYALKYPEADVSDLVTLKKHSIPVNEENLGQLSDFRTGEHKLADGINRFVQLLPDILNDLAQQGGPEQALAFLKALLSKEPGMDGEADALPQGRPEAEGVLLKLEGLKNPEDWKAMLERPDFKNELLQKVQSQWSIKPEELEAESLNRVYAKLKKHMNQVQEKLEALEKADPHTGKEAGKGLPFAESLSAAKNVENRIDFLREINQQYICAQLPLQLKKEITNGELYVFANKKNARNQKDGLKVLLHLDMEHLGGTDILIYLKGRTLRLKFTMEDEAGAALLRNHFETLGETLSQKGFTVMPEFIQKEQDFDFVEDFLEQDQPKTSITRYSFDMRA